MKYIVKLFVVTFLLIVSTYAFAEQKIAYLDMKYILNSSKAGKGAQDYLQKTFKTSQEKFIKQEKSLRQAEKDLLEKKTILSKEDYQRKTDELRKMVIDYNSQRKSALDKISNQRATAKADLLKKLNPIIDNFIKENSISLVIDKLNIISGSEDYNITDVIVERLNQELPSLNIK